jgi:SAM-dependent methyltransferase
VHKPTVTDADLPRLKDERERADHRYNEALTALDQALLKPRPLPGAAPLSDAAHLERLGSLWRVLPPDPVPFTGWKRRLGAFVWRMLGPTLQKQQEFNAALVEHASRSAAAAADAAAALTRLSSAVGEELAALTGVQARLIEYLQQITLYVDTKDRYETGLLWHELRSRTDGLAAGLSAIGDELLKRREHGLVAETRLESHLLEVRRRLSQVERAGTIGRSPEAGPHLVPGRPVSSDAPPRSAVVPSQAVDAGADASTAEVARGQLASDGSSGTYAGFEDEYRGERLEIRERLAGYLPVFVAAGGPVVDLGCGRGEFLDALRERGIAGRGVDINPAMVERCRTAGLDVVHGEALTFLSALPDSSLGGVLAAQVVEHLQPDQLVRLIDLSLAKLRPGGRVVFETVNPACWAAFFSSYIRDITHVRPIHPDTLRFLLVARGFSNVDVRYSSPYPHEARLRPLPVTLLALGDGFGDVVREFNHNVEILNGQLFTYMDYAAVGEKA